MDAVQLMVLSVAVLAASALQSATGVGFGLIAGPILLIVLNDSSGIQISILLNLLIALILARSLLTQADWHSLKGLLPGLGIGSPLGLYIYMEANLAVLKILAAIVVFVSLIPLLRGERRPQSVAARPMGWAEPVLVGAASGVMGGSLAMPGPVPAAWMTARGYDHRAVRATILLMFVVAYSIALGLQFVMAGIASDTLMHSATLVPATVVGIVLGQRLSTRIEARTFRHILIGVLSSTVALLLLTIDS